MLTLTPTELQSIVNAALIEIRKNPEAYKNTLPIACEVNEWLWKIKWDNPYEKSIKIDELPL